MMVPIHALQWYRFADTVTLCSDNAIVKTVAMIIMGEKKTETQVYNEVSNYLINNIDV